MKQLKTNIKLLICSVLTILFTLNNVYSQDTRINLDFKQRLDLVLDKYSKQKIKGLSASVHLGNKNVWKGAFGVSHDSVKIDTSTIFGIGSITKTFTAVIILQLYQEKKLSIYDPLYKWLPKYDNIDSLITIEQLLNHTSGLFDYMNLFWDTMVYKNKYPNKIWKAEEILKYIQSPYYPRGQGQRYSNTNYLLLGMIIEKVTGNTYKLELENRIIKPLGLESTFFVTNDSLLNKLPNVWRLDNNKWVDVTSPVNSTYTFSMAWSTGAIITKPNELALFFRNLLYNKTLVHDSILNLMKRGELGLGLMNLSIKRNNKTIIYSGHGGGLAGISGGTYFPEDSITIGISSNQYFDVYYYVIPELYAAAINEAPTDIKLSSDTILDYSVKIINGFNATKPFGTFTTEDINMHSNYLYTLVKGDNTNDIDNANFKIAGDKIYLNTLIDSTLQKEFHIYIKAEDEWGGSVNKAFVIKMKPSITSIVENKTNNFNIYPNPATSVLYIDMDMSKNQHVKYNIIDGIGRVVLRGNITNNSIPVSMLKKGNYILNLEINGGKVDKRFVIK